MRFPFPSRGFALLRILTAFHSAALGVPNKMKEVTTNHTRKAMVPWKNSPDPRGLTQGGNPERSGNQPTLWVKP